MKKLFVLIAFAALLMPMPATAQSAFDGTWKIDMKKVDFPKKPDVFVLQNGMYDCKTCTPPYTIKADGTDQSVSGHPYYDTVAIKSRERPPDRGDGQERWQGCRHFDYDPLVGRQHTDVYIQ